MAARRAVRKSFVGQGILILLGIELLFIATFTSLELPIATGKNLQAAVQKEALEIRSAVPAKYKEKVDKYVPGVIPPSQDVRYSIYSPQAPMAIFAGYTFGWPLATIACASFVVLGLLGPIFNVHPFAGGGGLNYYLEPGFGYLLGMIVATWAVGYITRNKRTSLNQILALLAGLASVHVVGLAYLLGTCVVLAVVEGGAVQPGWQQWLFQEFRNLSWYQLPYDALFGLLAVGAGFPLRWLSGRLTAPDIGARKDNSKLKELLD
jgi:biotin transporter BioY